jgi:hypothetical protein
MIAFSVYEGGLIGLWCLDPHMCAVNAADNIRKAGDIEKVRRNFLFFFIMWLASAQTHGCDLLVHL